MSLLDRYVLRALLIATVIVTVALTAAVWLTQVLKIIQTVIESGAPASVFGTLAVLTLPTFLGLVLPLSMTAALVFTYTRLAQESELIVMRAAGLGPLRLARPALILCLLTMALVGSLSLHFAPAAARELVRLTKMVESQFSTVLLRPGVFNTLGDGLTIYVRDRDGAGTLHGIMVHDVRDKDNPSVLIAEKGVLVDDDAYGPRVLIFDGTRQSGRGSERMDELSFDRYAIDLQLLKPELSPRFADPKERTNAQLLWPDDTRSPEVIARFRAEFHNRVATPLLSLTLPLIALAVMLTGEFSRRGQIRRLVSILVMVVVVQACALAVGNIAARRNEAIPLLYAVCTVPGLVALAILVDERLRRLLRGRRRERDDSLRFVDEEAAA